MISICIGTKSSSSYMKVTTQYNHHVIPPLIKIHQLRHNFLKSISIDILETIYYSEDESVHDSDICNNSSSNCSKSSFAPPDSQPILQFKCPILNSHNINNSTLKNMPLDLIYLKNLLCEVSCVLRYNGITMPLEKGVVVEKK